MSLASRRRISTTRLVVTGLVICLVLAGVVSLWASGHPDGLEFVAKRLGFIDSAGRHASDGSPFAGYGTAGVDNARLSGGLAGLVGVVVVALISFGLMYLLRRRGSRDDD
ncbi:putative ABC-type cobalt transport system, permease component [Janibacter sp. HTCC2649]|uniref:PDGLE domain-containing protein n=1 Tax=Janibacter sp. HTCC2649 TaxID=313589 RepID=UPI000066EBA0|nr:PDGLE domain-containing protein [Janibacter sp. HTCC2649]EAP99124.1 putative ABC-type cobalt transport system, permease component [Janibacter sp. HTCC2649]